MELVRRKRSKYRADGSMRPSVKRYKQRRDRRLRKAWLAEFEPGVRAAFFQSVKLDEAIFAGPFARKHGIDKERAEKNLAEYAEERGWLRLVTRSGRVVGIGPEKRSHTAQGT